MVRLRNGLSILTAGAFGLLGQPGTAGGDDRVPELRVMSFNIRYGTANDGPNRWDLRREDLVATIRAFAPDLLGTQETLGFQRHYLAENLPGYSVLGVGRDDGRESGEMMALYYRTDRFERIDDGHFWLSETPDEIGSKSWDSSLPRMATWVKLRDRLAPAARPILFPNTQFDHSGAIARRESARLIRDRIPTLGVGCSILLTGDFNTDEGSDPYVVLFAANGDAPPALIDGFRKAHPARGADEGTFNGFEPTSTGGARIDWIGVSDDWQVLSAGIDRTRHDGRTPSDHDPVTAVLRR